MTKPMMFENQVFCKVFKHKTLTELTTTEDSRFYFENNSTTQLQEYYYMNESQAEYITLRYIDK